MNGIFPDVNGFFRKATASLPEDHIPTLREVEQAYIKSVLGRAGGNKSRAARLLGLDRRTLYRRLRE